jgi:hypothetical protein
MGQARRPCAVHRRHLPHSPARQTRRADPACGHRGGRSSWPWRVEARIPGKTRLLPGLLEFRSVGVLPNVQRWSRCSNAPRASAQSFPPPAPPAMATSRKSMGARKANPPHPRPVRPHRPRAPCEPSITARTRSAVHGISRSGTPSVSDTDLSFMYLLASATCRASTTSPTARAGIIPPRDVRPL